ncbi:MAG: GTP 3',8-cyclase MoaA [Planctomycetota bacterium]|jgi:cyclic pyranopterin phosphate synthase
MPPVHIAPIPQQRPDALGASPGAELGAPRHISYLRVSVTDRCNLRCRYCMPENQLFVERDSLLSFEEITSVARVLVSQGVTKIRLTGGEPLLRRDVERLIAMLKALPGPPQVVMTTNGMLLTRLAPALRAAGLDRLNISLDTLRPERFERLSRRPGLEQVLAGIEAAQAAGFQRTKLNMVVMGGFNDDELPEMLDFAAARRLEQRFIEFMPMTSNDYGVDAQRVPLVEIRRRIEAHAPLEPRPRGSGPADTFTVAETGARVGIIAAISLPFCETCNRVRLTAEGVLRSCLFEGGEVSVRELVRADAGLESGLEQAMAYIRRVKPPVHDGRGHVQMNRVGG